MNPNATPNRLINESSPYLLQHAYNPVDWFPWGEEALQKAKAEDKPILVSIGYAACHWCHVMEHKSFEHEQIAELMNEHFVCIKVDREERPDVDQLYMEALQAMGVQGGWPLNVFLMPDCKPFYGGTYFPPENWHQLLKNIASAYKDRREELVKSAEQFATVLNASDLEKYGLSKPKPDISSEDLDKLFQKFSTRFDKQKGGMKKAPKFPMPVNYFFLLRYYMFSKNKEALDQVIKTLDEMAFGGIYDQIGGGFARYSTDEDWLVPHFEKMLYDNGQLISLYAEAYQVQPEKLFKDTVYQTIAFVQRELMSDEAGFYSSLDADSEGEEGKFYVFTHDELEQILGDEEPLFSKFYNATVAGNWEHGVNILHRKHNEEKFAADNSLDPEVLAELVKSWQEKLMAVRATRVRPGLDDKILTSWNALMLRGLADAYRSFREPAFLELALRNANFLMQKLRKPDGSYYHTYKNGKATVTGFLEDYALLISAFIRLYEVTFEEKWLFEARNLTDYTLQNFFDVNENLFYFTDAQGEKLIARKKEVLDNVIPASNSVMAQNLHFLGLLLDKEKNINLSETMLNQVKALVLKEPTFLANWATLYLYKLQPTAEIAIVGPDAETMRQELEKYYLPNAVYTGTTTSSDLPLLEDRPAIEGNTTIYVCFNKTCQLPVHTVTEALSQLQKIRSEMEEL